MTDIARMALSTRRGNWVTNVQRFVRPRDVGEEQCELCSAPIAADHHHLVEPAKHRLLCVCGACSLLLGNSDDNRYCEVPQTARRLENFHMTDAEWDAFGIPIGLAFFIRSLPDKRIVAFYPGPSGPMESLLDMHAWVTLVANNPLLSELKPECEALLVNRVRNAREYFQAPIDRCYALAGLIRTKWRGLSGGDEAWKAIDGFFAALCESPGVYRHG